jgi:3-keto-5-aminohexanoate cleavage enzyme
MTYADYRAGTPVVVTAALTGGVHGKDRHPNLPEQPDEIAAQAADCVAAGAAVLHLHARDAAGAHDLSRLQEVTEAVRDACGDDVVVQHSTGGCGPLADRVHGLRTDPPPEMASLDMGPFNRGYDTITQHSRANIETLAREMRSRGITPELEVFNGAQLSEVRRLIERGLVDEPPYVNLIFGEGFTPPTPGNVCNLVHNLPPGAPFSVLATGPHQLPLTTLSVILGGHVRVGMEDNLHYRRGEPVRDNAQLVERAVRIVRELERPVATAADARTLLGVPEPARRVA